MAIPRCWRFRRFLTPPPSLGVSQIGVDLRGVDPNPSQIGVGFSDLVSIGVGSSGFWPRAKGQKPRASRQLLAAKLSNTHDNENANAYAADQTNI
jgi:hypothetical protein